MVRVGIGEDEATAPGLMHGHNHCCFSYCSELIVSPLPGQYGASIIHTIRENLKNRNSDSPHPFPPRNRPLTEY